MSSASIDEPGDFLAACVPAASGNPVLEEIRDRGANAVLAIYRLVKTAMVHAADNQALQQTVSQSHEILHEFAVTVGNTVAVTFAGDSVFANGQLVRASRKVYELVWELGELLKKCGVSEVVIEPSVTEMDLLSFATTASTALRDPQHRDALFTVQIHGVQVRQVDPVLERNESDADLVISEQILRFYAAALLVMRKFFDDVAAGLSFLPYRIKRVSQRLVMLCETGDPSFLGLLTMTHAHRDDAGRALQSAILAVVAARLITTDRLVLQRVAMAALMADSGRVRLAGPQGRDRLVSLGEVDEAAVPASVAAVCIATGGINTPSALRAVVCHETTWMERVKLMDALYGGVRSPLLASRILYVIRALLDRLAPRDTSVSMSAIDALAEVAALPDADSTVLRLLIKCLGLIPVGSVVEFDTGEWGVVISPPSQSDSLDKPCVKVLTDRKGRTLDEPLLIDLSSDPGDRVHPRIAHVLPPKQARFNTMRSFVA
jgi:hypothetical protein